MRIPTKILGLNVATAVTILYAFLWMSLEGRLWRVVVLSVLTTAVALAHLVQKRWGGQTLSRGQWVGTTAVGGLLLGTGSSLLTLLLMAIKTGLHAHGPEFSPHEINWIIQQIPLWATSGLLAGIGMGLIMSNQR